MDSCEVVWFRKLFVELFEHILDMAIIFCDTKSWIHMVENPMFHDKSKHIEIKHHLDIWDMEYKGAIRLHQISINKKMANILTKALPKGNFLVFKGQLELVDVTIFGKVSS